MATTSSMPLNAEVKHAHFDNPAFDPNPGFDFDDTDHDAFHDMHGDVAPLDIYDQGGYSGLSTAASQSGQHLSSFSPFPVGTGAFTPDLSSSMDIFEVYVEGDIAAKPPAFSPPAFQTSNAGDRKDGSREDFGLVTPPESTPGKADDRKSSTSSAQSIKVEKLSKSERARNAANQRHAKSKQSLQARETRGVSGSSNGVEDGEEGVEVKKEKYREKNRIAAAKCRAKKKGSVDGLEEDYRRLNAVHNFLTRELRELRDEFSALRTVALQHTSATQGCGCQVLHEYNRRKASEVAYGLGGPMVASPSSEVMFRSHTNSLSGGPLMEVFGQQQAFSSSSHDSFAPVTAQEAAAMTVASNDAQTSFPVYMQGSAERGGFQS
ncbi:hypothetical protein LTR74_007367 [Friedmanniomyces endolithicus]|nr:hypothetical protein LTR74_007367 [Friedmanniomyces endolithicus]